jgi:hypothetical protein
MLLGGQQAPASRSASTIFGLAFQIFCRRTAAVGGVAAVALHRVQDLVVLHAVRGTS